MLVLFALLSAVVKIQGHQKSEMHQMTPNELEHLKVKSTLYIYTIYLAPEAQILVRFTLRPAVAKILYIL